MFAGRHFDREVILWCVRWYLRYKLPPGSCRDDAERGPELAHTTRVEHHPDGLERISG